eukprot:g4483.t1
MASPHQLAPAISCHAWNADRSMIALCPNSSEVWIFTGCHNPDSSKWEKKWVLTEHDLLVAGIDWSPITNKLVTCSHDRNAFVWTLDAADDQWKPELVILRINRAALAVKWSLDGNKFAVTSGAKCMPVCNYEEENSWWISKMIKKPLNAGGNKNAMFKSSVLCLDWHPNNEFIATGASDFHCRVFSATVEGLDTGAAPSILGGRQPFGNIVFCKATRGWVEGVAWSPDGSALAFCSHDATVGVAHFDGSGGPPVEQTISLNCLPASTLAMLAPDTIVACGHDFNPMLLTAGAPAQWEFNQFLDKKAVAAAAGGARKTSDFASARSMFESKVSRGQAGKKTSDTLWTKHEGSISCMTNMGNGFVSTTAADGRLVIWNLSECVK